MNTTITYIRSCLSRIIPTCNCFCMGSHDYIWIYKHLLPPSLNPFPLASPPLSFSSSPSLSTLNFPLPSTITNKSYSSKANSYDTKPWQKKIAAQIASALNSHTSWLGANWVSDANNECRLLDYACGTGSVTRVSYFLPLQDSDVVRVSRL
jgi:hypothetical protein